MIVAQRKPFEEIKKSLAPYKNILVAGCGTCVAVCLAGGKKEVGLLASQLRMSFGLDKKKVKISEVTLERQCDREFLETVKNEVEQAEAVLSLACGAGIQFLAEAYPERPVYPRREYHLHRGGRGRRPLDRTLPGLRGMPAGGNRRDLPAERPVPRGSTTGPAGAWWTENARWTLSAPAPGCSIYDRLSREGRLAAHRGGRASHRLYPANPARKSDSRGLFAEVSCRLQVNLARPWPRRTSSSPAELDPPKGADPIGSSGKDFRA